MRSDLRHTVFSAARFSDLLPAEVTGPGPQSPASSHLQRSRAYHPPVARLTIIQDLQKMSSNFSIYFTIFSLIFQWKRRFFQPTPFVVILPKTLRFISVRLRHNAAPIRDQQAAPRPPRPCSSIPDRPSSAKICHSDRSEKPWRFEKGKKFLHDAINAPRPTLYQ